MAATAKSWHGNASLQDTLVPISDLQPHPRNPRRGVVDEIRRSLHRFGQQRPLLALPDGTIVAGHHVWQAAQAAGWTHIAVTRSDLQAAEVDAYLLADNRLADLGLYDDTALADLLQQLASDDLLEGIGYDVGDVDALLAYLEPATLERASAGRTPDQMPYATGEADLYRIILTYDQPAYESLIARLEELLDRYGVDSYSEAIQLVVLDAAN